MDWAPLSARADSLPLVLAGPIVRRVEPTAASVWVALKASDTVKLTVLQGDTAVASNGDGEPTIALGDRLHVVVATATAVGQPLAPDVLYPTSSSSRASSARPAWTTSPWHSATGISPRSSTPEARPAPRRRCRASRCRHRRSRWSSSPTPPAARRTVRRPTRCRCSTESSPRHVRERPTPRSRSTGPTSCSSRATRPTTTTSRPRCSRCASTPPAG